MFFLKNEKQAHAGRITANILKTVTALALTGVLALYLFSNFDEDGARNTEVPLNTKTASAASPETPQAPPVVGHVISDANLSIGREYIGIVEPVQTVQLKPRVAGQIESVHFKEGSVVREGDLLFTIDSAQYAADAENRCFARRS